MEKLKTNSECKSQISDYFQNAPNFKNGETFLDLVVYLMLTPIHVYHQTLIESLFVKN